MLEKIKRFSLTARDIGPRALLAYARYQVGLASGYYRRHTPVGGLNPDQAPDRVLDLFDIPSRADLLAWIGDGLAGLIQEADEIAQGWVRLFGGWPVELVLEPPGGDRHWTKSRGWVTRDIKLIWEPARFGWAFTLGRAYLASGDEQYPEAFWKRFERFQAANPTNCGPNWESAQEVALRLIALVFARQVFLTAEGTTVKRLASLTAALVDHARRIPPTLAYAQAQKNNHLLSEATGLYLAGVLLPDWPQAEGWRRLGWRLFNRAIQTQVGEDGEYIQHSANYHRLAVQLGLVFVRSARIQQQALPHAAMINLQAAGSWLMAVMDKTSGRMPNLGHNDGALLLPLAGGGYEDYRPTAQAAGLVFGGRSWLKPGGWDELAAWLGFPNQGVEGIQPALHNTAIRRLGNEQTWASLRAQGFQSRPAHADQMQVEIWHQGENLVCDAGTYSYNDPPPWQNGLALAESHNSLMIDSQQPMLRAGRFLWLDWDQARWLERSTQPGISLCAERNGYRRLGVMHRRSLGVTAGGWLVRDQLLRIGDSRGEHQVLVHWLFKDGDWSLAGSRMEVRWANIGLALAVEVEERGVLEWLRVIRAGEVLHGPSADCPTLGWFSPTYQQRVPALSLQACLKVEIPSEIRTALQLFLNG